MLKELSVDETGVSATAWPLISKLAMGLSSTTVPSTSTLASAVCVPSAGVVIVTTGGSVSAAARVTLTWSVSVPTELVAVATRVLAPSTSGTLALKVAPITVAGTPFTVTVSAFCTSPETTMGSVATSLPSAGSSIRMNGGGSTSPGSPLDVGAGGSGRTPSGSSHTCVESRIRMSTSGSDDEDAPLRGRTARTSNATVPRLSPLRLPSSGS